MNKRGQFFILAAVILAAVLVSLSSTVNYVTTNKEPDKFYDLSYEIKQEGAEVINYGIYSGTEVNSAVQRYVQDIGEYVGDIDPQSEFYFIYGNSTTMTIENYAKTGATIGDETGVGCSSDLSNPITISLGGEEIQKDVTTKASTYYGSCRQTIPLQGNSNIVDIEISNQTYSFTLMPNQEFLIVARKQIGNETFIDIK